MFHAILSTVLLLVIFFSSLILGFFHFCCFSISGCFMHIFSLFRLHTVVETRCNKCCEAFLLSPFCLYRFVQRHVSCSDSRNIGNVRSISLFCLARSAWRNLSDVQVQAMFAKSVCSVFRFQMSTKALWPWDYTSKFMLKKCLLNLSVLYLQIPHGGISAIQVQEMFC